MSSQGARQSGLVDVVKIKFSGKKIFVGFLLFLVAAWLLGRAVLNVQLPDRTGQTDLFRPPIDPDISLRQAFEQLPIEAGVPTSVSLLDDNAIAWLERWRLLQGAQERLDICYFILKDDVFGLSFLGHLVQKAQNGVRIRVLLDAIVAKMSRTFQGNDYFDALVNTGKVNIRMYRPMIFRYSDAFLTLNPAAIFISEHDKILLADGTIALVGGRNIATSYFVPPVDDQKAFRDTDILLAGRQAAAALEKAFEVEYTSGEAKSVKKELFDLKKSRDELLLAYRLMDAWLYERQFAEADIKMVKDEGFSWIEELAKMPHLRGALNKESSATVSAETRVVDSRCRLIASDDPVTRTLIRLVHSAREEVFIQNPYLVLPQEAVKVLKDAAERGVRITLITNSPLSSDNAMSQGAFLEQWPELLAEVPNLDLYVATDQHNLHGKIAVIDRHLAMVGTYNLDPLSISLNSELVAAIWSPELAESLLAPREEIITQKERIVQYQIARNPDGEVQRNSEGEIIVKFGAGNHLELEKFKKINFYRHIYRFISHVKGDYPWY